MSNNSYETGAQKPVVGERNPEFDQDAAGNKPPKGGQGNSERVDENPEEKRQSDGTRSGDTLHDNGAGPAIAEHTKDADAEERRETDVEDTRND